MTVKNFYLLKMDGIKVAVPNELIAKGLISREVDQENV